MHDQRRQLAERDHAPRARDPARALAARAAALRRAASGAGPARSGGNWIDRRSSRRRPTARTSGRSSPGSGALCTGMHERRHRRRSARRRLLRRAVPIAGARRRRRRSPRYDRRRSGADRSTSRSAPARGATATARCPTASRCEPFKDAAARHRPRPDGPAAPRDPRHADRARSSSRRSTSSATSRACAARLDRADDGLVLVSRRHLRSNNSWMHNVKVLVKGKDRCTLLVHPDDAARSRRRRRRARPRQLRGRHASRCRSRSATR